MSDDYRDTSYDNSGYRTVYNGDGEGSREYNSAFDQRVRSSSARPDPAGNLLFLVLGIMFIKLPFVLVGLIAGLFVYMKFQLPPMLSFICGVAVFIIGLFVISIYSKIIRTFPKPIRLPFYFIEFVLVAGLQFIVVFSMFFNLFIPKELALQIAQRQAAYIEQKAPNFFNNTAKIDSDEMKERLEKQDLSVRDVINTFSLDLTPRETISIAIDSNMFYFNELRKAMGTKYGPRLILGIVASIVFAFAISFGLYAMYTKKYKYR